MLWTMLWTIMMAILGQRVPNKEYLGHSSLLYLSLRFRNSTKRRLSGWTMTRTSCLSKCSSLIASLIPCLRTLSMCSHSSMTRGPKETRSPQSFPDKTVFLRPPSELDCSRCSFFHQLTCQQQPLDAFGPNVTSSQAKELLLSLAFIRTC